MRYLILAPGAQARLLSSDLRRSPLISTLFSTSLGGFLGLISEPPYSGDKGGGVGNRLTQGTHTVETAALFQGPATP